MARWLSRWQSGVEPPQSQKNKSTFPGDGRPGDPERTESAIVRYPKTKATARVRRVSQRRPRSRASGQAILCATKTIRAARGGRSKHGALRKANADSSLDANRIRSD